MVRDRLLTEIERQQKYLEELPPDFQFPLFNSFKALESQRQSGYRTTASAGREIVDNSIEAGATRVHVIFDRPSERTSSQRRDAVSAVAFIDDGSGMLPQMARYALSWGGGTHFDDADFIGRFGFGLPNASINQTKRVVVYTRVRGAPRFTKAWLDIVDYTGFQTQTVSPPVEGDLPKFVQDYLDRERWSLEHGTVVVWEKPDRLTYRTAANLREHLVDDFGVTYRYLLKDFGLKVDGTAVEPVDPLFLQPEGRYHVPPEKGGSQLVAELSIPVKYVVDPETGGRHLFRVEDSRELDDVNVIRQGVIYLRVARLPVGFAVSKKAKSVVPARDEFSHARFEIRKPRRGMSFVRSSREIETVDVFPRRMKEEGAGLGRWPLLQGYAYHWSAEVRFDPNLDEVFGITNDKQTVRPIEDFWRVMTEAEVDKLLNRENRWQSKERKAAEDAQKAASAENRETPSPAELSAQAADVALGTKPRVPERDRQKAREQLERRAEEEAERSKRSREEVIKALERQADARPYRVEYVEAEHGFVYEPSFDGPQIVVRINKRHPFFTVLYGSLLQVPGGGLAKEAVDLVLIGLAKGELSDNEETAEVYRVQREALWSPFLATAMRDLERRHAATPIEEEVESEDEEEAAVA